MFLLNKVGYGKAIQNENVHIYPNLCSFCIIIILLGKLLFFMQVLKDKKRLFA